jgi:serine/threonine protein kinase
MVGTTISHYRILEKLGEGGMGVVYKAHDTKLNRTTALKFLPDRVNKDEAAKARFLQEAQAAAALNHPNICTIYGIEDNEGHLFISMEYIEGGTLREKLPFAKTDDALTIAMQIGEALQDAHAKGIVHRDIKADNVMLNAKGQAKVMDFGLAKLKGSLKLTRTSSTVGTLGYMAPEQIQGGEVDHRSDIFSFGVLLFEILTGKLPFRGDHEAAMVYSIVNEEPESIQKYLPAASPELARIIEKALEKDPAERYQTAADLVVDLRRVKKQSTKVSREFARPTGSIPSTASSYTYSSAELSSASQPQAGASFLSKHKWWIGGAGIALIAVATLAVFVLRPQKSTTEINTAMTTRVLEIPLTDIGYHGLSGDGNWAAFPAKDAGGNWHIYFMNTSEGEPKAITADSMNWVNSVDVSFDGSRVAYDASIPGSNRGSIFLTSALGGGSRLIVQSAGVPRWQPDGKRIFFLRFPGINATKNLEIWSVTPEGTQEGKEFIDSISVSGRISLSVSPDGKEVVWLRTFKDGNYQEVVVRNLASGAERQLTFNKKNIDEVCWVSNNQIIFSSNKSGNINLWMVPAEGGEQVQITKGLGPDLGMKISTDLKKLLYYERQDVGDFWISSLESGTTRQITFDDRKKFNPILSPDGKFIAFEMYSADPLTPSSAIYVSNRDGSNRRQLASSSGMNLSWPDWSPDGSRISYVAYNRALPFGSSGTTKGYVIDAVRTGAPKLIADGWPNGWLNSDSLLLIDGGKTWIASLATGKVTQFFEDSTDANPVPGGKYVRYIDLRKSYADTNWIVEVDASFKRKGPARRLYGRKDGFKSFMVSPSRDFVILKNAGGKLLKVWIATGKEEPIPGTFPNIDNAGNFSLNPGTNEFTYQVTRTKGKLVMIENLFK